ncbi:SDR family oxidoreductase [Gemmatimonas sp.]|uniref:SDR family oxidoreductase n=1 Tax=Gemmatimonas sp. TaxID=1962908 RepID=UPI003983AC8F
MNLVVGATGLVGSEVCRQLAAAGRPLRALVRPTSDRAKVEFLKGLDVDIVQGDLKERLSLEDACRGVGAVISTASATISRQEGDSIQTVDLEGQLSLIDAAKAAGVEHFVLISFPETPDEFPLQTAKRRVEAHLKGSGLAYTILQPTLFMEVWLSPALGFNAAGAEAQVYGGGQNKISWISYTDVAKFAVAALSNPDARNATIKLGGPEALSPLEVVRVFEQVSGKEFSVNHVPVDALRAQKGAAADPLQESFAALMLSYARGEVIEMAGTLRMVPGPLRSVREYAAAQATA